jgi:uncharacterized phiE125 gp8 family phage protein
MTPSPIPAAAIDAACAAARLHLRIEGANEDARLVSHAETAFALCEAFTGRATIAREWSEAVAADGCWQALEMGPVLAITGVAGQPRDAYAIDIDASGDGWVRLGQGEPAAVRFTAGVAADWAALPAPLRQGLVLLIAHLFEARADGAAPPAAVAALWRPWRRLRLDARRQAC